MRRNRSPPSIHAVLLCILNSQTITTIASVPQREITQTSAASVVLTATAALSAFSTTRAISPTDLTMNDPVSDSGTQTTLSDYASSSTSTSINTNPRLPLAGPMVAGVLVGIIVIAAIVVICFLHLQRHRRRHLLKEQLMFQSDSHRHSRNRFLSDDISLKKTSSSKKKYDRYSRHSRHSRYSSGTIELDVRNPAPKSVEDDVSRSRTPEHPLSSDNQEQQQHWDSGSSTNTTNHIGANKPHHRVVESRLISATHNCNNPALVPEVCRQHVDALIQPGTTLLAPGNTSSKSVYDHLLHLEEHIQILKSQYASSTSEQDPPPYERPS